jgi:nucleoside-diphosphate-sugar epimerase
MHGSTPTLNIPVGDLDSVVDAVGARWERLRGKRLFLTGGTGFIGKWLLATFLHANRRHRLSARVVVLSRKPDSFLGEFPELRNAVDIDWLAGDVRALRSDAAADCNFAIHAATDVDTTIAPSEIFDTCVAGTQRLLDAMVAGAVPRRVLLLSSGAVYGQMPTGESKFSESWMGAPDTLVSASAYGEGKRVSELLCAISAMGHPGLEVAIARCFAFVGPHLPLKKHFAIGNFIEAAMNDRDIHIQGDGSPIRSYLYAADLAHWLWVMLFDAPNARAYNLGGSESLSIGALAHRVNKILGGAGDVVIAQSPVPGAISKAYVPSIDRIAAELKLTPSVSLDDAILRTALWAGYSS